MSQKYTHVIEIFPEKVERGRTPDGRLAEQIVPARYVLSRWDTGLIIGMAQGHNLNIVFVDEEKTAGTSYRDEKYALAALRRHADEDARKTYDEVHAFIEEIEKPAQQLAQPSLVDIGMANRSKQ